MNRHRHTSRKTNRTRPSLAALALIPAAALVIAADDPPADPPARTALDEYVAKPDGSYSWKVADTVSGDGHTTYIIDLVSQTWLAPDDVDRTEWRHWLTVVVPESASSEIGFLWIGGGRNGRDAPGGPDERIGAIARATGSVVAELGQVPNQPLEFHGDGRGRSEDDLIAYTWDQFLENGDPTWLARNPMVKSAVRAMDTMTALTTSEAGGKHKVEKFVVAGGSKRGWTTWMTGAVDKRVVAIVPIVIDVLNVSTSMLHHFAAYGFWAPSIGDYVQHRLMERFQHPRMKEIYALVDPFAYRHRLTMPKLILNASGDQFFLPDSSQFYFSELEGEKHLRYVPNADHSLRGSDAVESIIAFYSLVLAGRDRPRFAWTEDAEDAIHVTAIDAPKTVRLWQAHNPAARDFRMETLGPEYTSTVLEKGDDGAYVGKVSKPAKGWTAYFVELEYDVGLAVPLKLTTGVRVVPDVLPHADRDPTRPATISIVCEAPSAEVAKGIEAQIGKLMQAMKLAKDDVLVKIDGTKCRINWTPTGRLEESGGAVTAWLREKGCRKLQYELHAGPDAGADE